MKKMVVAIIGYGMSGKYFHVPPLYTHKNYSIKYVTKAYGTDAIAW